MTECPTSSWWKLKWNGVLPSVITRISAGPFSSPFQDSPAHTADSGARWARFMVLTSGWRTLA